MKKLFFLLTTVLAGGAAIAQSVNDSVVQQIPGTELSVVLVKIPAGSFTMGSEKADAQAENDEMPTRTVKIDEFYLGKYELDYAVFDAFSKDQSYSQNNNVDAITRPSSPYIDLTNGMGKEAGYPANSMQLYSAIMFCKWLHAKTGVFYRLPTEAEWEYASRAGAKTTYPFGNDAAQLKDYAWYQENSDDKYHPVGTKKPNAWGVYDMLGNVEEWVLDHYDSTFYTKKADVDKLLVNPPTSKHPHALRGGSYQDPAADLRPANRFVSQPIWNRRDPQIPKSRWWNADAPFVGMRLVRPVKQPTVEEAEAFYKQYMVK